MTMPSPFKGGPFFSLGFPIGGRLRTALYVDFENDPEAVGALYGYLRGHQAEIESVYGEPLSWEAMPGRRASRVAAYTPGEITRLGEHGAYVEWFLESGERLRRAISALVPARPRL
jgi:hypothetical protein